MMITFLTIVVVMLLNTILTTAFLVGGLEYLYEKIEKRRTEEIEKQKPKEEIKWE